MRDSIIKISDDGLCLTSFVDISLPIPYQQLPLLHGSMLQSFLAV
jgi:hypothetical protein